MAKHNTISTEQWEAIKLNFLRLYHEENKSLDEVRLELEETHQFIASKSAFKRQIGRWGAFKNYKEDEKQQLRFQRVSGQRPETDSKGRPVDWERVYRANKTKSIRKANNRTIHTLQDRSVKQATMLALASKPPSQLTDYNGRIIGIVVDIWRESTIYFASKDPYIQSYQAEFSLYRQLMSSIAVISTASEMQWPKQEIDYVCDAIPYLLDKQPAMACEVLIFLAKQGLQNNLTHLKLLKAQLFTYIRNMSRVVLPENHTVRQLLSCIGSQEELENMGSTIAKAKLHTMWNIYPFQMFLTHHNRPFFRQVLINAISGVEEYGESEFASQFSNKLRLAEEEEFANEPRAAVLGEVDGLEQPPRSASERATVEVNSSNLASSSPAIQYTSLA